MPLTFTDDSSVINHANEYFLASDSQTKVDQTANVILQAFIDLGAMAAGDAFTVKVYEKVNGNTQRVIYQTFRNGPQSQPVVTPSLILGDGWEVSIQKTAGANQTVHWSLRTSS